MKYIKVVFVLIFVNLFFAGCVPKFASLAETGNIENLEKEIKTKRDRQEALSGAAVYGKIDVAKYLIKQGADVNYRDDRMIMGNVSPAIVGAAVGNQFEMVKLLVENGADVNKRGKQFSAIYLAAYHGYLDIVKYLAEQGAKISKATLKELDKNFIPILLKAHEDGKIKREAIRQQKEQLLALASQKKQVNIYIKDKDFELLKLYTEKYPNSVNYIKNKELRLGLTGPKNLKIGDIRKLLLAGKSEIIIISLIKQSEVPYKKFSLDEIDTLTKIGLSDNIISAMIDITTQLLRDEKLQKQQEYFLKEQNKRKTSQTRQIDSQGNPIMNKVQDEVIKQGVGMLLDQLF